jgi:hypothetical protein
MHKSVLLLPHRHSGAGRMRFLTANAGHPVENDVRSTRHKNVLRTSQSVTTLDSGLRRNDGEVTIGREVS